MPLAIRTDAIGRRFGGHHAVEQLDLAIDDGEVYGFLGPNGAGKSTSVRMLTTLLAPTSGRAEVCGHDVVRQPDAVRLRIGVALQDVGLDLKQTGRELLDLQGRLYGLGRSDRRRRIDDLIALVDLGPAIDRRVGTYSGGMKRRLDLAIALVHHPAVLFLDEPTTGLDPVSRAAVWDEVRFLNRELGTTVFLTTQYLEEADALADRVGIIAEGRLVAEDAPTELKRAIGSDVIVARVAAGVAEHLPDAIGRVDGIERIEVQCDEVLISVVHGPSAISPVAVAIADAGFEVHDLTLRTPTLDDVFFRLTGGHLVGSDER